MKRKIPKSRVRSTKKVNKSARLKAKLKAKDKRRRAQPKIVLDGQKGILKLDEVVVMSTVSHLSTSTQAAAGSPSQAASRACRTINPGRLRASITALKIAKMRPRAYHA